MELADFLLARIAEDEELAREADRVYVHPGAYDPMFGARKGDEVASRYWDRLADPDRVLAECAFKREIVRLWSETEEGTYGDQGPSVAAQATYALAAVYSEHPDYRSEWARVTT